MTVIDDLRAARNIIEQGWCKGRNTDGNGSYCILGAVGVATKNESFATSRYYDAVCELRLQMPEVGLPDFNDDPSTTKEDVLGLFDKAIAELGGMA